MYQANSGLVEHLFWIVILTLAAQHTAGANTFADYAEVLSTQPIYEVRRIPVSRQQCTRQTGLSHIGIEMHPGDSTPRALGNSIRTELEHRAQLPSKRRCHTVESWEQRQYIVGYRVWYRYQGQTLVRQMDHNPGERLRVLVDLEPVE